MWAPHCARWQMIAGSQRKRSLGGPPFRCSLVKRTHTKAAYPTGLGISVHLSVGLSGSLWSSLSRSNHHELHVDFSMKSQWFPNLTFGAKRILQSDQELPGIVHSDHCHNCCFQIGRLNRSELANILNEEGTLSSDHDSKLGMIVNNRTIGQSDKRSARILIESIESNSNDLLWLELLWTSNGDQAALSVKAPIWVFQTERSLFSLPPIVTAGGTLPTASLSLSLFLSPWNGSNDPLQQRIRRWKTKALCDHTVWSI